MARTIRLLPLAALLLAAAPALAQSRIEDLAGLYGVLDANGQRVGTANVAREGQSYVLRFRMNNNAARPELRFDRARSGAGRFLFAPPAGPSATTGLSGALAGTPAPTAAAAERTVELASGQSGLSVVHRTGGNVTARERMARIRSALMVHASTYDTSHVNAFRGYAAAVARIYRARGYTTTESLLGTSIEVVIERLNRAAREGVPFDRLIFIGHGGWDGPVLGKYDEQGHHQASAHTNPEVFTQLVSAIQAGMTSSGKIFSSSCHAGGSNVYERANANNNRYVWVDDLAARTGRVVAGPAGYTSTEYTERHVLATLEGEGTTVQEVRWASTWGVRSIRSKGTLTGTPLQPVAPIALPTPPAPTPQPVANQPLGTNQ